MKIWFLFSNGRTALLMREPDRVTLTRQDSSPADVLSVQFFAEASLFSEEPHGIRAEWDGRPVFSGIVDEHTVVMEKGIRQESFVCRSTAALLLDCEAMPGVLQMPSLRVLEKLYLKPFGLCAQGNDFTPKKGQLTVERGTRCWTVLCEFAEQFLHCTPRCSRDGVVCFSETGSRKLALPEPIRLTVTRKPSARLSRIVVQNSQTGAYSTVYTMPGAPVLRTRYLSAQADTGPDALFAQAEREALQVHVICSGYIDADPGDRADFSAWDEMLGELEVVSVRFSFEAGNSETELVFAV